MKKIFILSFLFLSIALPVFAQGPGNPGDNGPGNPPTNVPIKIENPFKFGNNLYQVLESVVNNIILPIGGILCVLAFIYSGFQYVTAGGDKAKIKKASDALLYAAIGTALVLGAWIIAGVIRTTLDKLL